MGDLAGGALNTSLQTLHQAQHQQGSQLSALVATKATLSGVQARQAVQLDQARGSNAPSNTNTIGVNAGFSHSKSSSEQRVEDATASGSTLSAERDQHIHASESDIHAKGATLEAGRDTDLAASRDIALESADNRQTETSSNHASGSSIGMTTGVGSGGMGYSTGGGAVTQFVSNLQSTNLNTTNHSGHDSSTTHAAVSPGQLTIRDGDNQHQDLTNLRRDPEGNPPLLMGLKSRSHAAVFSRWFDVMPSNPI
ncbi:hemagglutinin repeat-containing protein [Carnimonas bestiolae]|uniref:hemagglutinin repeat-containing protein n=1 Tax=Carnimonas bestiolae TaxID=3402172 RepID=UPI003EDC2807